MFTMVACKTSGKQPNFHQQNANWPKSLVGGLASFGQKTQFRMRISLQLRQLFITCVKVYVKSENIA